jgi:fructose-1-phosphate kinase PfkB-like protein
MQAAEYLVICLSPTLQKTLGFSALVPDTVNRCSHHRLDAAGKGVNVCRVLAQLGKKSRYLTQLGGEFRPLFLNLCRLDGVEVEWTESGSPIRFCYTLLDQAQGAVTELVEESEHAACGTEEGLREAYSRLLPDYAFVVISGSRSGGFSDLLLPWMVREAKQAGKRVILDIRGKDLLNSLPYSPDVIKPNLFEFAATFAPDLIAGNDSIPDEALVKHRVAEICRDIWQKYHTQTVLTRGSKPVWFTEPEGSSGGCLLAEYPFEPIRAVVNTTGSGDASTAGLASALGDGADLREAIAQGVRCGCLNAGFFRIGVIRET